MHKHELTPKIEYYGLNALANLIVKNVLNQAIITDAGAIPAMRLHRPDPEIQATGFHLLANLALKNRHNQTLIAEAGAITVIVQGMCQHNLVLGIQQMGFGAQDVLTCNRIHDELLAVKVAEAEVIPIVVQAMRQHQSEPSLQGMGCFYFAGWLQDSRRTHHRSGCHPRHSSSIAPTQLGTRNPTNGLRRPKLPDLQ